MQKATTLVCTLTCYNIVAVRAARRTRVPERDRLDRDSTSGTIVQLPDAMWQQIVGFLPAHEMLEIIPTLDTFYGIKLSVDLFSRHGPTITLVDVAPVTTEFNDQKFDRINLNGVYKKLFKNRDLERKAIKLDLINKCIQRHIRRNTSCNISDLRAGENANCLPTYVQQGEHQLTIYAHKHERNVKIQGVPHKAGCMISFFMINEDKSTPETLVLRRLASTKIGNKEGDDDVIVLRGDAVHEDIALTLDRTFHLVRPEYLQEFVGKEPEIAVEDL